MLPHTRYFFLQIYSYTCKNPQLGQGGAKAWFSRPLTHQVSPAAQAQAPARRLLSEGLSPLSVLSDTRFHRRTCLFRGLVSFEKKSDKPYPWFNRG